MWRGIDSFSQVLLDASVSASLLLGVVTLGMLSCRQPARRLLLARASFFWLIWLFPAAGFHFAPKIDLLNSIQAAGLLKDGLLPTPKVERAIPTVGPTLAPEADDWTLPAFLFLGNNLARALVSSYCVGVGLGLARMALGSVILGVLKRTSEAPSEACLTLYATLPYPDGRRRRPELRIVSRIQRPVLAGFWGPMILIPPDLDHPDSSEELRLALLHELAHAEGRDPLFGFFANLSLVFWFFMPPIWWIWSRNRLDQEFLADRRASTAFGRDQDYAASLLKISLRSSIDFEDLPGPTPEALGKSPRKDLVEIPCGREASAVYQRVSMLLRCPFPIESRPPRTWTWSSMIVVASVATIAATVSVRPIRFDPFLPGHNTFTMARLDLEAAPTGGAGRAPSFEFPVRLPESFELTVDIWASLSALSRSRVAGLSLETESLTDSDAPTTETFDWHNVYVKRDAETIEVWIDGRLSPLKCKTPCTSAWLSVEPAPGFEGSYQNLTLTW